MKATVAIGMTVLAILSAPIARADDTPGPGPPGPTPPPDAPKCMQMGGSLFPHLQYLPCGWQWVNGQWIPPAPGPPNP
jgi:hypothetical protein